MNDEDAIPLRPSFDLPDAPTQQELRTEIESCMLDLREVDRMLAEAHHTLARRPEHYEGARCLLSDLLEQRMKTAHDLGLAMANWLRAGGALALWGPTDQGPIPRPDETTEQPADPPVPPHSSTPPSLSPTRESTVAPPPALPSVHELAPPDFSPAVPSRPVLTPSAKLLSELLALVGPPRYLNTVFEVLEEVEGLEELTRPAVMGRWPSLPKPAQRALLAMAVARTRAVKDKGSLVSPGVRDRLKVVIATFPAYAKRYAPGYVNGLQLGHDPEGLSWRADGVTFWEQLQRYAP